MPTSSNRDYLLLNIYQSGITDPKELAVFMGQMEVESGGFNSMHENLNYSGRRLLQVFPNRNDIDTLEDANAIAQGGPEAVANAIYGGEWGRQPGRLGNTEPGDGWRFHGRGYVQLTGRDNYTRAARELGIDLVGTPDLAAERETAASIALHYWNDRVVANEHQLDVREATFAINGGYNHLPERKAAVARWERALTPEVMEGLARDEVLLPAVSRPRSVSDPTVGQIQQNLNDLGISDAAGRPLVIDGNRGGPGSRTNESIAAFRQRFGLDGQMSNAELLAATQVALNTNPARNFDRAMRDILPPQAPAAVNGMPDYLLPGRNIPPSQLAEPALRPLPTVELQPGDRGATVLALQQHLRLIGATDGQSREIKPDSEYGDRTREAVEQFQLWTGREPTGIADKGTLEELQTQSQFVTRQRAQGVTQGAHLADNLQSDAPKPEMAADLRPVQGREAIHTAPVAPTRVPPQPARSDDSPVRAPITQSQTSAFEIPANLHDFRHEGHPRHIPYQRFMDGLHNAQAGYLQDTHLPHYAPEQQARIAAGLTAALGTQPYFGEVARFHQDKDGALWASNRPPNMFEQPRWVKIDLQDALTRTPEQSAAQWRERELPARTPLQTQAQTIDPQQLSPTDLRHPEHPRHAMFTQVRGALSSEYDRWGLQRDPTQLDREASQVMVEARGQRITEVGGIVLSFPKGSTPGQPMVTLLENPSNEFGNRVSVDSAKLAQAPQMEQASSQLQQVEQQVALMQQQELQQRQEREMAQGQARSV